MGTTKDALSDFLEAVGAHYAQRDFPARSVLRLLSLVRDALGEGVVRSLGGIRLHEPLGIADLDGCFPVPAQVARRSERLHGAQAVFAFAFGYRHKSRGAEGCEIRLPGPNNRELAAIAARLKISMNIPVCAQFEIADAHDDYMNISADVAAPCADLGTIAVARVFADALAADGPPRKVVVVAHGHHSARCLLVVQNDLGVGIEAVPSTETYVGYDPREAQARVVSPDEFIVNDFVSMASHGRWRVVPPPE
ncbi:MAG: hypothetical protein P8181_07010 [bacterium]